MKFEKSPSLIDGPNITYSPSIIEVNDNAAIFVQNQQDFEENYYSSTYKKNVIQTTELKVKKGVISSPIQKPK